DTNHIEPHAIEPDPLAGGVPSKVAALELLRDDDHTERVGRLAARQRGLEDRSRGVLQLELATAQHPHAHGREEAFADDLALRAERLARPSAHLDAVRPIAVTKGRRS